MATKTCNYCHEPIDFIQLDNAKWRPVNPGTRTMHRCKLEQTCVDCNQIFEGAPWMTRCPVCFKAEQPHSRGFHRPGGRTDHHRAAKAQSKSAPGPDEKVEDDWFDDIPF